MDGFISICVVMELKACVGSNHCLSFGRMSPPVGMGKSVAHGITY